MIGQLAEFFKWMTIINFVIYIFSIVLVIILKKKVVQKHARMFDLDEGIIPVIIYAYFGIYKIGIIIFSLVPYLALLMMK